MYNIYIYMYNIYICVFFSITGLTVVLSASHNANKTASGSNIFTPSNWIKVLVATPVGGVLQVCFLVYVATLQWLHENKHSWSPQV